MLLWLAAVLSSSAIYVDAHAIDDFETRQPAVHRDEVTARYRPLADNIYISHRHEPLLLANKKRDDYVQTAVELAIQKAPHATFRVVNDHYEGNNGVRHVYLKQTHNGIDIANADMNVNIAADGSIVSYGSSFAVDKLSTRDLRPADFAPPLIALRAVKTQLGLAIDIASATAQRQSKLRYQFNGIDGVEDTPWAELKYYKMPNQSLKAVWMVRTFLHRERYDTFTDAVTPDNIVAVINYIKNAAYEVYPWGVVDPGSGEREIVVNPWDPKASEFTWQGDGSRHFNTTWGNNVVAQENWEGHLDPLFKKHYRPHDADQHFVYDYDLETADWHKYVNASITQVFYTANMFHDLMYELGFDEKAGNYQSNNSGQGGKGHDFMLVFTQDSGGTNNAQASLEVDGVPGRVNLYMGTKTRPHRDSAFDATIVIHELTHGVSHRLVGGRSNAICIGATESSGMDEGWGDAFAAAVGVNASMDRTQVATIAAWYMGNKKGWRRYPYSTDMEVNPWTYGDIAKLHNSHGVGEVWAATLYDLLWLLIDRHGVDDCVRPTFDARGVPTNGRFLWMKLVLDGMALLSCNPNFVQARDGIIDADFILTDGQNECIIWQAFARRGLGSSAVSYSTGLYDVKIKESFDVPDDVCP